MVRLVFAIVLGMVAGVATMLSMEFAGMALNPPPPGAIADEADLALMVMRAPLQKQLMVVAGWGLAAFVGGWVAARTTRLHVTAAAVGVAALIMAGVVLNAVMLPHPIWMPVAGVLLPVPLALLAVRLLRWQRRADA